MAYQLKLDFSAPVKPVKNYSISRVPTGFKVVLAPGLTTKMPPNPCFGCAHHIAGKGKEFCAEFCANDKARNEYLSAIGIATVSGVSDDGQYGIGS